MNAYYTQKADKIFPIYGVNSIEEAKQFIPEEDHCLLVETEEDVYMNIHTGIVDFESGWDNLDEVVKVIYSADEEEWVEAE